MISLEKTGNAIKFTFDNNGHYLQDGTIEVPVNSLTLVTDDSEMFTFKKSATNDIFVSGLYSEIGMSKSELETFYKDNMVGSTGGGGGGGITSGEVQTMIDASISGKADYSAATFVNEGETETTDYAETGTLNKSFDYDDGVYYFSGRTLDNRDCFLALTVTLNDSATGTPISVTLNTATGETDAYIFYKKSDSKELAVTAKGNYRIVGVSFYTDVLHDVVYTYKAKVAEEMAASTAIKDVIYPELDSLEAAISGKADTSAVTNAISAATDDMATQTWVNNQGFLTEHQSLSAYSTTEDVNNAIEEATSGKADTSAVTAVNNVLTAHTADTTIHVTSADKTAWNAKSDFSGSYNDLTDKPTIPTVPTSNTAFTNDAGYITEDALSGYAESSAVTEEITAAVSGKQDTLVSGTNIKTINNESILGSGNITIQGGGGNPTVELTQAEYDALVSAGTVSADTYYIITDAPSVDISNYWTSAQTQSAITEATSGKVDTTAFTAYSGDVETALSGKVETSAITSAVTSASTDSEIPTAKAVWDVASQGGGGGGTTYSAGRGIDITNDTISFKYDIGQNDDSKTVISILGFPYADKTICTNTYSDTINGVFIGGNNQISGIYNRLFDSNTIIGVNNVISATSISNYNSGKNIILGESNKIVGSNLRNATAIGSYNSGNTSNVLVCGYYNISNNEYESSFGKFNNSVSGSSTFGDSGNTLFSVGNGTYNARHNAFEIRQNADIYVSNGASDVKLQDYLQIKVVKLTQQEYDALVTKDNNTLYVIT